MNYLRKAFSPPTFEGDAEKTRRAEVLHVSSILLFIFPLLPIYSNLLTGTDAEKSINWILGFIVAMQIVIQWMIRKGHINEASFILLTLGWASLIAISWIVDGIRDVVFLANVLVLLGSGYLLGWRIAIVYTLASIVAIWWLAYMEVKETIVPSLENTYGYALDQTFIYILIFLVIYFLRKTLTKSFENAQRELDERLRTEQALEIEQERLHLALDAAHMGTWEWSIESGLVSWSSDVPRLFGLIPEQSDKQFNNLYEKYLSLIHPEDLSEIQDTLKRALSGEIADYIAVHRLIWPNGEIRWLENRGKVYRDDKERPIRMAGTIVDVTDRKQVEIERERLIQVLEAKNKELEQFTYTVSHDLKAPLITINGFLGYLEKDMAAGDLGRVNRDSQRIQEAVGKMRLLLDQLLELSRIGRMMNPPEEVAFEELAREALDNVQGRLEERDIAVKLNPNLPSVYGDRQRLVEVLQNLLDNAAKFMGEQSRPEIVIGQQGEENGLPVFFVKDNGVGIAPEHHDLIFDLFQRLDPKTDGTGIGLALVKRIVEYHGGRIWVESASSPQAVSPRRARGPNGGEAGEGSTFYFTLSRPQTSL